MLEKKLVPFNFVQGADTKVNDFIDDSFNVAQNVTFDGDLTAKKIKGFDSYKTIPSATWENIAKVGVDLLLFGSAGVYKALESQAAVQKLSTVTSSNIDLEKTGGELVAYGTDFRCLVGWREGIQSYWVSYQEKDGKEVNSFYRFVGRPNSGLNSVSKLLAVGNKFYLIGIPISPYTEIGFYEITSSGVGGGGNLTGTNYSVQTFIDAFVDGTNIYIWSVQEGSGCRVFKYDTLTSTLSTNTNTLFTTGNGQVTNKDANTFWVTWTGLVSATVAEVRQRTVDKTTLAPTGATQVITSLQRTSDKFATPNVPMTCAVALSDTTAVGIFIDSLTISTSAVLSGGTGSTFFGPTNEVIDTSYGININRRMNFIPLMKPFLNNGEYVFFGNLFTLTKQFTILARGGDLKPVAVFSQATFDATLNTFRFGDYQAANNRPYAIFAEINSYNSNYYSGAFSVNGPRILSANFARSLENGGYEISSRLETYGQMMGHFDGEIFSEASFVGEPLFTTVAANGAGGTLAADTYQVLAIYECIDYQGDVIRSGLGEIRSVTTTGSTSKIDFTLRNSLLTCRLSRSSVINIKFYIRKPGDYFRLGSTIPLASALWVSQTTSITDYPTSTEFLYTEPATEENALPTSAVCMNLYGSRLFYVPKEDKNEIRYSRVKQKGIGFEFVETFRINTLDKKGKEEDTLKAFQEMDGRLIVFKSQSILYLYGQGPADDGTNNDFGEPQLISTDAGCISQRAVVLTPVGIMFKSDKGIYLLNRKLEVDYIGSEVEAFNNLTISSAVLFEKVNEVRFTTLEGTTLIYNYYSKQWSWSTSHAFIGSCFYKGSYHGLDEANLCIAVESQTSKKYLGNAVVQTVTSPWVKVAGVQGYQRLYNILLLAKYKTEHKMHVKVYYDYENYSSEEYVLTPLAGSQYNISTRPTNGQIESGTDIDGVYQLKVGIKRQKCQSVKIEIFDEPLNIASNTGESYNLINMTLEMGVMPNGARIQAKKSY